MAGRKGKVISVSEFGAKLRVLIQAFGEEAVSSEIKATTWKNWMAKDLRGTIKVSNASIIDLIKPIGLNLEQFVSVSVNQLFDTIISNNFKIPKICDGKDLKKFCSEKLYGEGSQQFPFSRTIGYYSYESISNYFNLYKGLYYGYLNWNKRDGVGSIVKILIEISYLNKNNQVINCRLAPGGDNALRGTISYENIDWEYEGFLVVLDNKITWLFEYMGIDPEIVTILTNKQTENISVLNGILLAGTPGYFEKSIHTATIPSASRIALVKINKEQKEFTYGRYTEDEFKKEDDYLDQKQKDQILNCIDNEFDKPNDDNGNPKNFLSTKFFT